MQIRRVASVASLAGALALSAPAVAQVPGHDDPPSPCPEGYILTFDVFNVSGADANDNDMVCTRTTSSGDVFVDDRI
jgi:hypothetical protein